METAKQLRSADRAGRRKMQSNAIAVSFALLVASNATPPQSDYLRTCIARNGKIYFVDANTSHCHAEDEAIRCMMSDNQVINTRGPIECTKKGGRPLGYPKNSN
jgi:hypothetical protein